MNELQKLIDKYQEKLDNLKYFLRTTDLTSHETELILFKYEEFLADLKNLNEAIVRAK